MKITPKESYELLVSGELDYQTAAMASGQMIAQLKQMDADNLMLDCKGVTRMDSAGIALLLQWKRWANNHKKQISFTHLPEKAISLIKAAHLEALLVS